MIIRLTVSNNDYGMLIDSYFKDFRKLVASIPCDTEDVESMRQWLKSHRKITSILNSENKLSQEDIEFLINRIKQSFSDFILKNRKDIHEYLMENLDIKILKSMTDRWENGEVWYYFEHSGKFINQ